MQSLKNFRNYFKLNTFSSIEIVTIFYFSIYFIVGLFTLKLFPTIFIDEPWLGEISFNFAMNGRLHETSFPHYANNLSWFGNIFLLLNSLVIKIFEFNIGALRFFSLTFFVGTLIILYLLIGKLFNKRIGLFFVIIYSLNPFAINLSRIARFESSIIFFLVLGIYYFYCFLEVMKPKRAIFIGFIFSLPLLIHVPGFLSVLIGLFLFLFHFFRKTKCILKNIFYYLLGTLPCFLIFLFNFFNNKDFFIRYGKESGTFSFNYYINRTLALDGNK